MAEAVERPNMRFVPIKTEEQLDLQAVHRVRERWVRRRTAVVNQIRGLLLERGLTLPKGRWHVDNTLPDILEDASLNLSSSFRVLLAQLKLELDQTGRVHRTDGYADSENGVGKRGLPAAHRHSWNRPGDGDGAGRRSRQRQRLSQRARFGGVGRHGAA